MHLLDKERLQYVIMHLLDRERHSGCEHLLDKERLQWM